MLLLVGVGLLLFWDASTSQGCSRGESCAGLVSKVLSGKDDFQHRDRQKEELQKKVSSADGQGSKSHRKKGVPISGDEKDRSNEVATFRKVVVEASVSFDDSVLLILNPDITFATRGNPIKELKCLFAERIQTNVLSIEHGFIRCDHPSPRKTMDGSNVTLLLYGKAQNSAATYGNLSWKKLVYNWVLLEDEGDALLFVKGISRTKKSSFPENLTCLYGNRIRTKVVASCQENVRCKLPPSHARAELVGKLVTLEMNNKAFPSVVRFYLPNFVSSAKSLGPLTGNSLQSDVQKPFHLCVCTMVWNGAKFLQEWVIYHSHLGVQRFFLYDNNSDDDIGSVMDSLQPYNVSRHPWPWLKTQEAGFSHCAIRAARECAWVAFIDIDEFMFPRNFVPPKKYISSEPPLHAMIKQYETYDLGRLGQLRISNFNFGPSGLTTLPKSGQIVNYICRLHAPKRVKSIVKVSAINIAYCSRVHHFDLKQGFMSAQCFRRDVVIHHYKYQVWEDFKMKFVHRAATFVADWQEREHLESFDRTPGLGTEAVEPPNWAHQFCDIEDTALRDYVLNASQLQSGGKLLWE